LKISKTQSKGIGRDARQRCRLTATTDMGKWIDSIFIHRFEKRLVSYISNLNIIKHSAVLKTT